MIAWTERSRWSGTGAHHRVDYEHNLRRDLRPNSRILCRQSLDKWTALFLLCSQRATEDALVRSPRTPPLTLRGDGSIAALKGCVPKEHRGCDADYRPGPRPPGVTKYSWRISAAAFIRKRLISLGYILKFLERIGKGMKLSEAFGRPDGNFRQPSESFSKNGRVRRLLIRRTNIL
jgi:hypothetical protein